MIRVTMMRKVDVVRAGFCVCRVKVRARASNSMAFRFPSITTHHFSALDTRLRLAVESQSVRRQLAHVCRVIVHRPATIRAFRLVLHLDFSSRRQRHRPHLVLLRASAHSFTLPQLVNPFVTSFTTSPHHHGVRRRLWRLRLDQHEQ